MSKKINIAECRTDLIYVDSNIFIYFLEGEESLKEMSLNLFECIEKNSLSLCTSEITIAECLYGAYKKNNTLLVNEYNKLFYGDVFSPGTLCHFPTDKQILERAAQVGAERNLKLIDAIHFATALRVDCGMFVTNDRGIKSAEWLDVVQIVDVEFPLFIDNDFDFKI